MVYNNILEAVGNTPLVQLQRIAEPDAARILVKFEAVNVGGSIKTRTALQMIQAAEARGDLKPDAVLGYKARIIMPDSVSVERRRLVVHYGAQVLLEHDDGDIGACVERCIQRALRMAEEDPRVYVPQQFENRDNLAAQSEHTAKEILAAVDSPIDGFCSGVGTGGTITGIGRVLREANPAVRIWAVEPENAAILSGGSVGTHLQMGIGDGIIPEILDTSIYDDICIVTDIEAMEMSRRLAREEGLLCGISSGTNVAAAVRLARELGPGKTVVTILPDTGERYISTMLFCGEEGLSFA